MIAKCLQNLANLVEFGGKVIELKKKTVIKQFPMSSATNRIFSYIFNQEPYMEVVNPFILKNKERMIVFLDQLSSVTDPNPPPGTYLESNLNHKCSDTGKSVTSFEFAGWL